MSVLGALSPPLLCVGLYNDLPHDAEAIRSSVGLPNRSIILESLQNVNLFSILMPFFRYWLLLRKAKRVNVIFFVRRCNG